MHNLVPQAVVLFTFFHSLQLMKIIIRSFSNFPIFTSL